MNSFYATKKLMLLLVMLGLGGCGQRSDHDHAHSHSHQPPHGGIALELGTHQFNLELVLDPPAGRLQAYVFDAHMENFVRIKVESFELLVPNASPSQTLVLKPVVNAATGEKIGDSSLFEVQADWLKTNQTFDAVLKELSIRSKKFTNIAVRVEAAKPSPNAK